MSSDTSSGTAHTKLHRNPFAVLGASMTSKRAEINELAENKAFVLDEAVVQDARRVLTNPMARLTAEVGWLPGMSEATIQGMLSAGGLERHITISAEVLALTRANVLAALLELRLQQGVSQDWMTSQLTVLLQLVDRIELGAVEAALNTYRQTAGFPGIDRRHLAEAIKEQRTYFLEVCQQILNKLWPAHRSVLLSQLLKEIPGNGDFLHTLVDDYAFASTTELQALLDAVKSKKNQILRFPKSSDIDIERLTKWIEDYGERARAILLSREQRGLEHEPTLSLFREVRGLVVDLSNQHQQFDAALKITLALRNAIGVVGSVHAALSEDIETLSRLITTRNEYARQAKATLPAPANRPPTPSPQRWPGESTSQTVPPKPYPQRTGWNRIPAVVKVIAILLLIGWGGNALKSDSGENSASAPPSSNSSGSTSSSRSSTTGSQSASRCANIDAWWDATDVRWNRVMSLADDPYDAYGYVDTWVQTQMRAAIGEQRRSDAPSAAIGYNNAIVAYMEFVYDTVSGTSGSGYAWETENDRLFDVIKRHERDAASSCGIILT